MPIHAIVILAVVIFLIFLLSIRVKVCLVGNDTFAVSLKILFIKIPLYPRPRNPKKIVKQDTAKPKKKAKEKKVAPASPKKKKSPTQIIRLITYMLKRLYKRFPGYFKIKLHRFVVRVGGDDAAKAAICYGAVRAGAAYLLTTLDTMFYVKTPRRALLEIAPDFLNNKISCDIRMDISISVFAALRLALRTLSAFLSGRKSIKTPTEIIAPTPSADINQ